jgi:hypothetical protein
MVEHLLTLCYSWQEETLFEMISNEPNLLGTIYMLA